MTKIDLKEKKEDERPDGLIFYTDGGARPNPGFIGWGFHGYTYKDEKPKKGSGNSSFVLSTKGYIDKNKKDSIKEVTPINYFDGYGCSIIKGTNNLAELLAAKTVIQKATELKPKNFLIKTDSEYVRKGIEDWSHAWARNNWVKQDGTVVNNSEEWKNILNNLETLRLMGTKFKIEWVKGHSEHLGNNLADKLATVGVMSSTYGESKVQIDKSACEGYWKTGVEKNGLFSLKRMYFNTLSHSHIAGEYYLGDHGKDDEMLGKRISDGSFAVIQLKEQEPILELVRKTQTEMTGDQDSIVMVRLDEFFNSNTYNYIEKYGKYAFVRPNKNRLDLFTLDNEPLTRELKPPLLAARAIEALSTLKGILDCYKNNNLKDCLLVDITDKVFSKSKILKSKKEITECKLLPSINSTTTNITINPEVDGKPLKVIITLGIDIPTRNSLKSLEHENIKINVLIYKEVMNSYRYVTIIENGEDYGIFAGVYSNIVFHI